MSSNMRRRVGYYVENEQGTFDASMFAVDFQEEHYKELEEYCKVIFDVQPIVIAFEVVRQNLEEIFLTASSYTEVSYFPTPGSGDKPHDH
jgi:hypothetical protein